MEKNKKNRVKINAFDVFLILLVFSLIVSLAYKIYDGAAADKNSYDNDYVLTFSCDGEYDSIIKYVKSGDAIYLPSGELLGYITVSDDNKSGAPLVVTSQNNDEAVDADKKQFSFVSFEGTLKMNGNAKKVDKGNYFLIGDDKITEGAKITVHTITAEFTVSVVKIAKINKY